MKPPSERREEHIKELVNNSLRGLFLVYSRAVLTSDAVTSIPMIFSKNLSIDKIKLEISKRALYFKGAVIFNSYFLAFLTSTVLGINHLCQFSVFMFLSFSLVMFLIIHLLFYM